ncbi:MAG: 6,7-dimethyl-8-ribityllumazine synthase [Bacteroidales bacterium]|jgi:6,7-dimethyl-8-ribityllumazine synthase|nr:6,7-dimethyl-8-ribityllumazine synthase [Bacteroidales bacterium]
MEKKKNLSEYNTEQVPDIQGKKVAIITAEWNFEITSAMERACVEVLLQHGFCTENIIKYYAAGSYELPFMANEVAKSGKFDAVVCIGCIIQGETRHFDFIAQATANGIMRVGLKTGIPVVFGVLTTNNMQQAMDRAGGKHGNKGTEAAVACLKLLDFLEHK